MHNPSFMRTHKRALVFGLVTLIAVLVLIACGESGSTATNVGTSSSPATAASTPQTTHFKVKDQVKIGSDWVITINSVSTSAGKGYSQPQKSGNHFVVIDITMKNTTSKSQNISSLLDFHFRDNTGQEYTEGIAPELGKAPDGMIEAGALLRGQLIYEVGPSQHTFTLSYAPETDFSGGSTVTWDITAK